MHGHLLQLNVLLCVSQAVAAFIHLEPRSATVLRDSEVHFNCSTSELWDVMTWLLDGRTILTISVHHGPLGRDEIVSAVNHSTWAVSVWELVLMNAPFRPTVQHITCELLPTKASRPSSALSVQEKGNVSILQGDLWAQEASLVMFHCQATGWYPNPTVSWAIGGITVERGEYNSSDLQDSNGLFNCTSVLQVKAELSTTVECQVSTALAQQTSGVKLTVVLPIAAQDYTVTAVTVIVCSLILMILTLILTLYCKPTLTKSRSENTVSSFQWFVHLNGKKRSVAEETRGKVNPGFHTEDVTGSGHSDLWKRADSMRNISSPPQVPDVVVYSAQNQMKQSVSNLCNKNMKRVRRVTTV